MNNLEITIYGGIVVAIVTLFVLTPLRNYVIGFCFFKRSPDNNEGLPNIEKNPSKATPRKSGDITSMERTRSLSFNEARKIAKKKSDADVNLFKAEEGAQIEASLLKEAKKLLVSGQVHTFKDAKKLAKELSEAEIEIFKNETFKRIELELLKSAKKIIDKGEATSFEEVQRKLLNKDLVQNWRYLKPNVMQD